MRKTSYSPSIRRRISMWKPNFTIFGANYCPDFSWHLKLILQPNWDSLLCCKNMLKSLPFPPLFSLPEMASSPSVKLGPPTLVETPLHQADSLSLEFLFQTPNPSPFFTNSAVTSPFIDALWWYLTHATSHGRYLWVGLLLPSRENVFYSYLHHQHL